ncbi:RNA 3'-terminal phosphate cyclase [Aeoliella mucimassa]|uniref:RNA 3'-terminal phosphate cyclase n=1 Tax=Aeoliella mucimassa TaxID=2527972 RepID=UPI001E498804|nr:RNA 3'-terminal phosphate cyclase [Aeoliella mucimassa]
MPNTAIDIDGSQGEGGGQILRSSLTLSIVTGRPVHLTNIRAGRDKPGLMRQHLTAVRAAAEVAQATVDGDDIKSQTLHFAPTAIASGQYHFAIGTAGSGTLVLQTVLPALLLAKGDSEIIIEGGTHNQWAPPFDFLQQAYFPLLRRMGADISVAFQRYGFYPAGGGRFEVSIVPPAEQLQGLTLLDRGEVHHRAVTAVIANLSRSIAQRELQAAAEKLNWPGDCYHLSEVRAAGPGNIVIIELHCEHVREVFTGFGRIGAKAEGVALEAVSALRDYQAADVPVGPYLADQLILPLSLAAWQSGTQSQFRTMALTRHSTTHIDIVRRFLEIPIDVDQQESAMTVTIG